MIEPIKSHAQSGAIFVKKTRKSVLIGAALALTTPLLAYATLQQPKPQSKKAAPPTKPTQTSPSIAPVAEDKPAEIPPAAPAPPTPTTAVQPTPPTAPKPALKPAPQPAPQARPAITTSCPIPDLSPSNCNVLNNTLTFSKGRLNVYSTSVTMRIDDNSVQFYAWIDSHAPIGPARSIVSPGTLPVRLTSTGSGLQEQPQGRYVLEPWAQPGTYIIPIVASDADANFYTNMLTVTVLPAWQAIQ